MKAEKLKNLEGELKLPICAGNIRKRFSISIPSNHSSAAGLAIEWRDAMRGKL